MLFFCQSYVSRVFYWYLPLPLGIVEPSQILLLQISDINSFKAINAYHISWTNVSFRRFTNSILRIRCICCVNITVDCMLNRIFRYPQTVFGMKHLKFMF